jgi:hypothetical protein
MDLPSGSISIDSCDSAFNLLPILLVAVLIEVTVLGRKRWSWHVRLG